MDEVKNKCKISSQDTRVTPKKQSTQQMGNLAEQAALDFLIKKGFVLLARQYRCKMGECDLIMKDKNVIVFVEVRYKQNTYFCSPEETIDYFKQRKLIRTAEFFLARFPNSDCRMDVIAVTGQSPDLKITWIPDAFQVE